MDVEELAAHVRGLVQAPGSDRRVLVGITGSPGAGKSTLAEQLVATLRHGGTSAVLVPMDGFHLAQRELDRLGNAAVKGAPGTFDAAGFVALLERLQHRGSEIVYAPEFRRELEEPVAGAIPVGPEDDVVVTEGNYLLLSDEPWVAVRELLDEVWFLELDPQVRRDRLADRHQRFGRSVEQAWERTLGSDEANALLVESTRHRADRVLPASGGL